VALITGSAQGSLTSQEEIYLEGAPTIYYADERGDPLFNPDGEGYYYGLTGTATYPAKGLACVTEVSFKDNVTANDIRCDTVGIKGQIQRRDSVELTFSAQTFFPLSIFAEINNFSTAKVSTGFEKVGIGVIDNNQYWMVYCPKVYDTETGDYLLIHLHKAQFVEHGEIQMRYGEPWIQQFTVRGFANDSYPDSMLFGTIMRVDPSALL